MNPPALPVGLNELGSLTTRGLAAFAARAARRAMELYRPSTDDERTAAEYFLNAIDYADSAARGDASELPVALLDQLFSLADQVAATAGYAGFAAAHAARVGARSIAGAADQTAQLELIASTFGATRVLYTASGDALETVINTALRTDFDALIRLDLGPAATPGQGVDPSPNGPLGPLGR
ncbi:hypothetical protein [Limnoglobus roseus]|nr:hypothetical protein [Limnoglobus roseus]